MRLVKLPQLTADAEAKLRPIFPYEPEWLSTVADLEAGRAELFVCPKQTYAILRVDWQTRELIIVALAGEDARGLFQVAVDIARGNNLPTVRFHTQRAGLSRLLSDFGPVEAETVYRVQVTA